jgi:hypothetical protein
MNSSFGEPVVGVPFKICPLCDYVWPTRDSLLSDSNLKLVGYQADFEDLQAGVFLFNHSCKGTMAIRVGDFSSLYDSIILVDRATGSDECREYCVCEDELRPCPAICACAHVRELMEIIRDGQRKDAA